MKRAILWVLGLAGLAIPALANNQDIVGWQDAKWGMTPEEVQKVLKYPTSRSDLSKVCGERCEEGAALELEDYVLDSQHFMVRFWFTKADEHLHVVSMYLKKSGSRDQQPDIRQNKTILSKPIRFARFGYLKGRLFCGFLDLSSNDGNTILKYKE